MAMANSKGCPIVSHMPTNPPSVSSDNISDNAEPSTSGYHLDFEESGRGCRTKRKQFDPVCCPVCSVTVRPNELETHYMSELSKLEKISQSNKRKMSGSTPSPTAQDSGSPEVTPEKCWETYQNVKQNRQSRLKIKSKKRKNENDVVACPVCNNNITGDLNQHVEDCLRKSENGNSSGEDDIDVDIDVGGADFEEYEWAGQHRVRASSILEGGYTGVGIGIRITNSNNKNDNEEEELIVDGDDSEKYGPVQYTERDIILVNKNEDKDQTALRLAIIGSSVSIADPETESISEECSETEEVPNPSSSNPTIEALKARVRELEQSENIKTQYKCLICMGRYKTPVISICCWHVHCELCWFKTLGIKKLCPQCNMITSPGDLRKIFI